MLFMATHGHATLVTVNKIYSKNDIRMPSRYDSYFSKSDISIRAIIDLGVINSALENIVNPLLKFNVDYYDACLSCGENVFASLTISFIDVDRKVNYESAMFKLSIDTTTFQNVEPSSLQVMVSFLNGSSISYKQQVEGSMIDSIIPFSQFIDESVKILKFSLMGTYDEKRVIPIIQDKPELVQVSHKRNTYHEDANRLLAFNFLTSFPFNYSIQVPQVKLESYYNNFCNNGQVMIWLDALKWKSTRDLEIESGMYWDYRNYKRDMFGNLIEDFSIADLDVSTGITGYEKENIGLVYSKITRSIIQFNVLLNKSSLFKLNLPDVNFKQTTLELVDNEGWKGQVSRGKIQSFKIPYKFTKHVQELYLTCLSDNIDNPIHLSINYFHDNSTLCNGNEMQRQVVSSRKTVVRLVPNSNDNLFEKTTYYFNIFVGCLTDECSFHMHFSDNYQASMDFIKENDKTSNKLPTASGEASNSVVGDNSSVIVPTVLGASLLFESVALFTCIILLIICLKKNQSQKNFTKGETMLKDESDQSYTKV